MGSFYADIRVTYDKVELERQRTSSISPRIKKSKISTNTNLIGKAISFASGKVLTTPSIVLSKVGSYTGNKIQTSNINANFKIGAYALAANINPYIAVGKFAIDSIINITDFNIRQINSQQETDYRTSLIGKSSTSNSRWRGNYK